MTHRSVSPGKADLYFLYRSVAPPPPPPPTAKQGCATSRETNHCLVTTYLVTILEWKHPYITTWCRVDEPKSVPLCRPNGGMSTGWEVVDWWTVYAGRVIHHTSGWTLLLMMSERDLILIQWLVMAHQHDTWGLNRDPVQWNFLQWGIKTVQVQQTGLLEL